MEIVINSKSGEFDLSNECILLYSSLSDMGLYEKEVSYTYGSGSMRVIFDHLDRVWTIPHDYDFRADPELIAAVKFLGDKANTKRSVLKIVEIPDNVDWMICVRDGIEYIAERHRSWY